MIRRNMLVESVLATLLVESLPFLMRLVVPLLIAHANTAQLIQSSFTQIAVCRTPPFILVARHVFHEHQSGASLRMCSTQATFRVEYARGVQCADHNGYTALCCQSPMRRPLHPTLIYWNA